MRAWSLLVAVTAACGPASSSPSSALPSAVAPGPPAIAPECAPTTELGQHALYTKITGKPFVTSEESFYEETCLGASPTFFGLLTFGTFATEVGCLWSDEGSATGAIYECKIHATSTEVAALAMARAGWSDTARRGKLALAWVTEVEHFDAIEHEPNPEQWVADVVYTPPATRAEADGGVTVDFWIALPTMGNGIAVRELAITFSATGVPAEPKTLRDGYRATL
jgi:hypothetical protein